MHVTPDNADPRAPSDWHALSAEEALARLDSALDGLDAEEAARRRARYGPNRLRRTPPTPSWRILIRQFRSVIVLLLLAAAVLALALGDRVEAAAIAAVLVINTAIGFVVELRARRAMDALLRFEAPEAKVRRSGVVEQRTAADLVPGDIVEIEEGDAVPADGRLLTTTGLRIDEAPLTGESIPVDKHPRAIPRSGIPLAERTPMAHAGTVVVAGRGAMVVTGTGSDSEIGRIGLLLATVEAGDTPLEERLDRLGRRLVGLTLVVAAFVAVVGILRGLPVTLMVETGIALAIAAVPEGLPAVATIALAVGLRRMARRNALVRRLAAVETLGGTTVVCTDKTGTLTAGRMTVSAIATADRIVQVTGDGFSVTGDFLDDSTPVDAASDPWLQAVLQTCALTNRASVEGETVVGDPTDAALLVAARKAGLDDSEVERAFPRVAEIPFDTELRLSASIHADPSGAPTIHVKGSPEAVLERSTTWLQTQGVGPLGRADRMRLAERNQELAEEGFRVIALAQGAGERPEALTFLGLAGIVDPPAEGVRETIRTLASAGVRLVLITGDQRATARAIADRLEIRSSTADSLEGLEISRLSDDELLERSASVAVYSRVSPADKVRIVNALQGRGETVAMIGDGVNDAAAIKKADVGVAMGGRGTDVAREAAAIVLSDDRFLTIGAAVEEGRVIFDNIRKFVFYLFSCNLAEIAVIVIASVVGAPMPLQPLQILWLNLVTDTFPALALALEPAEPGVMDRPPRSPDAPILSRDVVRSMAFYSGLITVSTLGVFAWGLSLGDPRQAGTMAFSALALAQLFHLGNARSRFPVVTPTRVVANRWALAALPLVLGLQVMAVHWAPLASVLETVPLDAGTWGAVIGAAAIPAVLGQGLRWVRSR